MKQTFSSVRNWQLVVVLVLMLQVGALAQAPTWQAAVSLNTVTAVGGSAADASGNVYLTGSFSGTAVFGPFTLTSAGGSDIFVVKWSTAAGRFLWAQRAGGARDDGASAVAVSGTSVYITGSFSSVPAFFGSLVISNSGFLNTTDLFVAKLTDTGSTASFTWTQQTRGIDIEWGSTIAVSGANVYVAGMFEGPAVAFGATSLTSFGRLDIFIAKLTDAGTSATFIWAQRMGSSLGESVTAIVANGSVLYLTGESYGTITFGNGQQAGPVFNDSSAAGVFVVKLTDAGPTSSYTWVQRARGQGYTVVQASALAVEGPNVYISGDYNLTGTTGPSVTFGSTILGYPVGSNRSGDTYLAKLTDAGATGSFTWARQAYNSPAGSGSIRGLRARGTSLYLSGTFSGSFAAFGNTPLISSAGSGDVLVAKLTDTGTSISPVWAQRAGGVENDGSSNLLLSGGSILVTGSAMTPASFGAYVLTHSFRGVAFNFLASLTDAVLTANTPNLLGAELELFPNPAHAFVTVQLPVIPGAATATFTVLDALGRAVRTTTATLPAAGLHHELALTGLPVGLYALRVAAGEHTATRRLMVE